MNIFNNEKNLINFIRYGATFSIIIFSFFITYILVLEKIELKEKEIKEYEISYIENKKIILESLVNKVHNFIKMEKRNFISDLKDEIKEEVYQAHSLATIIYNNNISKSNYSEKTTIDEIKKALGALSFLNGSGYFYIYNSEGVNVLHKIKDFENKKLNQYEKTKTNLHIDAIKSTIKNKTEKFDEYFHYKEANSDKLFKKIGFYKYFEPYNFAIGAGEFIDEYEKRLQKRVLEKINTFSYENIENIFIYNLDTDSLIKAFNKNDNYIKKEISKIIENNDNLFISKYFVTNEEIFFIKMLKDWNWFIVSSFNLNDLKNDIKEKMAVLKNSNDKAIMKIVLISLIITLFIIAVSFYMSNIINKIFKNYKSKVNLEMKNTLEKEKLLIQQSKMATMGEMIGNIAHQWKQPLSLISMSNGLLRLSQEDFAFIKKEEKIEAIDNIETSVKHLTQTIDDFRNFFRPDKEKRYFYTKDIYEKTMKLLSAQFKNHNIEMFEEIENFELFGFQNEILQVLINILKNADDELAKLNSDIRKLIFVKIKKIDDKTIITIKDNAGGIDINIIDKIFDAYFTTKDEDKGTGIGLYMSKQIIEGMNGTIVVQNQEFEYENKKYKGAAFKIVL